MNPAHQHVERDTHGRFQPGNGLAVTHALSAVELPPELQHLRAEIADYEAACLVDEGDPEDMPIRRRSLVAYRARVHRRIVQIDDSIELRGLTDKNGRLRIGWLSKLESLIGVALRVDAALGLERRAKRLPNPLDYIAGKCE